MLRRGSEELLAAGVPVGQLIGSPQMMVAGAQGAVVPMSAVGGGGTAPAGEGSGDEEAEDDQEAQEKKKKMKMDFGLSKQRPERVTLEVLKDLIRDNPQKMVQAARAWLVSEPEKE
jgi:flagellar biosynthesis/type III secretory pathway M-ring protein FliF/YscJ